MATAIEFNDIEEAITESLHELMEDSLAELFNQVCYRKIVYKAEDDIFVELRLAEDGSCVYCNGTCWDEEGGVCPEQFEDATAESDCRGAVPRTDMPDDVAFIYDNTI